MTGIDETSRVRSPIEHVHVPDATEDQVLLARLRAGEDCAFGELFSRHADAVRRLARGLVNDRAEAEDLTAEAFFRVLQAIRRGNGPMDNVRGYLLIVARRVAWEWSVRRRDVPVSDEELTSRAGADRGGIGQSAERNLITQAFTSLPERWRSVLWKVEVEGERPAVVAHNFGLSANATAALARRARQGLRAAYLQAHLTVDRGATGCRSVLEKLGAYTAGSIKGAERRRIRLHLTGCHDCQLMHDELQDVCSGLRVHAGVLPVPALIAGGAVAAGKAAGLGAGVKSMFASTKAHLAMAASAAAAVGVFGIAALSSGVIGPSLATKNDFDGHRGIELSTRGSSANPSQRTVSSETVPTSTSSRIDGARVGPVIPVPATAGGTVAGVPGDNTPGKGGGQPRVTPTGVPTNPSDTFGETVSSETRVYRQTTSYATYAVVRETTVVTQVNKAGQTRTTTTTRESTRPLSVETVSSSSSQSPQTSSSQSGSGTP